MVPVLDNMVYQAKLETNRRSVAPLRSGLRAWHAFALGILDYPEEGTLPPRSDADAESAPLECGAKAGH